MCPEHQTVKGDQSVREIGHWPPVERYQESNLVLNMHASLLRYPKFGDAPTGKVSPLKESISNTLWRLNALQYILILEKGPIPVQSAQGFRVKS